jgi:hypothetical protein
MTTEKEYAFVSCRVLKPYGVALAHLSADEDLALATFVAYELSKLAAERKGLPMPEKPEKKTMPDREDVEKAAKARGVSVEEYMAIALKEAVKRDVGAVEPVRKASGTYAKTLTPAKLNRQLRASVPPSKDGTDG